MTSTTKNTIPAAGASFLSDLQNFLREEDPDRFRDMFIGFIVSGGTHVTGAGLVHTPDSLTAYPGGHFITETGAITYPDSTTHIWVICHKDTTTAVTDYTRVSGTHYLFRNTGSGTKPALPVVESAILMKVTTSGGAVTVVEDHRELAPVAELTSDIDTGAVFNEDGLSAYDFRVEGDTSTHLFFCDASANRAGVSLSGNLVTDGLFHIASGTAGTITANANADELIVEGAANVGMTFLGGNSSLIQIAFGDDGGANSGRVIYDLGDNVLQLFANDVEVMRLRDNQGVIINDTGSATQDFRVESDLNTHMLFVDASNNSVHIDNSLTTGATDGDLVLANGGDLLFNNNAGTTSANYGIASDASDNLTVGVPATTDNIRFFFAGVQRSRIQEQNGGMGLLFLAESSSDHSGPGANNGTLYTKDVGGRTGLFWRDSTGVRSVDLT